MSVMKESPDWQKKINNLQTGLLISKRFSYNLGWTARDGLWAESRDELLLCMNVVIFFFIFHAALHERDERGQDKEFCCKQFSETEYRSLSFSIFIFHRRHIVTLNMTEGSCL